MLCPEDGRQMGRVEGTDEWACRSCGTVVLDPKAQTKRDEAKARIEAIREKLGPRERPADG